MSREDKLEVTGTVIKVLKGTSFDVQLENDQIVRCTISGKLRMNNIRIVLGDSVTVEMSPYDLSRGIITWRNK